MKLFYYFVLVITLMIASATTTCAQSIKEYEQKTDSTKTIITKVKGITCSTDLKMISANVEKLTGVASCSADKKGPTTTFQIVFNPSLTSEKEIHIAIQNTGSCENPDERPYTVKK